MIKMHGERLGTKKASAETLAFAVREGFEPSVRFDPYDSLANCWFRPLTHLTITVSQAYKVCLAD